MASLLNLPRSLHVHDSDAPRGPGLLQVSLTDELRMLIMVCTYEGVRKRGRHTIAGYEVNDIPSQLENTSSLHCFCLFFFAAGVDTAADDRDESDQVRFDRKKKKWLPI